MQKNKEIIVKIQNLGSNGEGVAIENGMPIFIPYALTDEVVKIKILKVLKNFSYGKLIEIQTPSKDRVVAPCPYFTKCGGCDLQHLSYEKQLEYKTEQVKISLKKYANIDYDVPLTIPSDKMYEYRNKLQLPLGENMAKNGEELIKQNVIGMYAKSSHRIVPISDCKLHGKWAKTIIEIFNEYIKLSNESCYNEITKKGNIKHIAFRYIDNKLMITVVIKNEKLKNEQILIDMLKKNFDNFSLYVNINKKDNNVIFGDKFILLYGNETQECETLNIKYEISPQSFMQVNTYIQNKIYNSLLEKIDQNSVVIDAYSGAGLLSSLISKKAKQVYGIEIVDKAVENASDLAQKNGIKNMNNYCGDCANILPKVVNEIDDKSNLEVVIDPPRKGCDETVLQSILDAKPNKIFYISCNPSMLSRDLKFLAKDNDYKIDYIQPFDMFPQTIHVETLCTLIKQK